MRWDFAREMLAIELCEKHLEIADVGEHGVGLQSRRENIPVVPGQPKGGLPLKTYLPILVVTMLAFLGVVGYFLKIGLGTTGATFGPTAQQGDANIRAIGAPVANASDSAGLTGAPVGGGGILPNAAPGEVVVPQSGGGNPNAAGPNGVGGGTPVQAAGGGPPAPVMRLLVDLRGRLQKNPNDLAALVSIANLYFDAAKYAQAIQYYKRALAIDPANPDTRTDYATALHGKGDDLIALRELESVLTKRPDFPEALFNQGVVANAIGRRSEAIDAFKHFLKVKPSDQRAGDARQALTNLGA